MTAITPEIRQAIEQAGDNPARVIDPETKTIYVLVRAEDYERMRSACDFDCDIREAYPLMDRVASGEGWDDPTMDTYNE